MTHRRGIVLVLVLVVISLLTLAGLTLSELMLAERRAAQLTGQQAQARALAESGVEMARHFLDSDPDTQNQAGGWYNNAQQFCANVVLDGETAKDRGRFTILAPQVDDLTYTQIRYGLSDESARLNLATVLALDKKTPGTGEQILMNLPGMTQDIADALLDWMDSSQTPRANGAKAEYYGTLSPPYQPRNDIPTTIEEFLLVRDVTPQLLFGLDTNRNGLLDPDEPGSDTLQGIDNSDGSMNCGWAAYLTLYSAESTLQSDGTPKINLNSSDLQKLHDDLSQALDPPSADFICAYRLVGNGGTIQGEMDLTQQGSNQFTTVLDLVGAKISRQAAAVASGPGNRGGPPPPPVPIPCPFPNDPASMGTYLTKLQDKTTTASAATIPGRININQAPQTVLQCIPNLTSDAIQQILALRTPDPTQADPGRKYATWLLSEGLVSLATMKQLMPLVTGGGSVYRAQVVGYYEEGRPFARLEAVIDATQRPARIVFWKDLTRLGSGYPLEVLGGSPAGQ
jgi:type II secretory pathway component PulK